MFSVDNQYLVSFSLEGTTVLKDFIEEEDLLKFTIIEEAGNVLPSFELIFKLRKSSIISYLNEGNVVKFQFGVDKRKMSDCPLADRVRPLRVSDRAARAHNGHSRPEGRAKP